MRTKILALLMVSMFALGPLFALPPTGGTRQDVGAASFFSFSAYNSYAGVRAELVRISSEYPGITNLTVLGSTWEGRDIMALRLTDKPHETEPGEPAVLIMGGHHGNELASVEVPMHILSFLTENYGYNATVREMVDSRDIWFVPLVNPDGREHALNVDPAWRKNRRPIDANGDGNDDGIGVDLNRNYGHRWGELPGASHDPASNNYCGPNAFSEAETMAVRDLAHAMNFSLSVSYHTYGEVIYYPWNNGFDTASPKGDVIEAVAGKLGAITGYAPMQGVDAYPTTGDSDDWLYAVANCLPFTVELGTQYVTPPEQLEALYARNLGAALWAIDIAAEPGKALLPEWTFMVYMSADLAESDPLDPQAMNDLNHMEAAGGTDELNIVVLYDGSTHGDSRIYDVQRDPGGYNSVIVSPAVDDGGAVIDSVTKELDMSDPSVVRNFVSWTLDNYPARKNLLAFWGHGDGVLREFVPDHSGGGGLRIADLNPALGGFKLDIVGFDTCSLGHFEVAEELVGIAEIMIGSEAEEPIAGWDYFGSLDKLARRPWMPPRDLATTIVSDYLESNTENYLTQAAIDLAVFRDRLVPALGDFVNVSLDFAHHDFRETWAARNLTDTFVSRQDAVDLFEFLGKLEGRNASGPVIARAERILDMREELVIGSGTGISFPDAGTMAVYFPRLENYLSPAYAGFGFLETGWRDYLAGIRQPQERPFISLTTPHEVNNTLGPYEIAAAFTGAGPGPFLLFHRPGSGLWQYSAMQVDGQNLSGSIPGHPNGTVIEYYLMDEGCNITEPYEVKWGGQEFFALTVFAACDISVDGLVMHGDGNISAGYVIMFSIDCSNAGPEPAAADVVLVANQTNAGEVIGATSIFLAAGETVNVRFNWTARPGNWTVTASAHPASVMDLNLSNQARSAQLNVAGADSPGFLEQHRAALLLLAILWASSAAVILHMLRKARRRRGEAAARSIAAARDFLGAAEEMGGDIAKASIVLARAEAALARKAFPECEKLVREAREAAMSSVAKGGEVQ